MARKVAKKRTTKTGEARKYAAANNRKLMKELLTGQEEPSYCVTVKVGRTIRDFVCTAKSERGARRKALNYYREVYPDRESKVISGRNF